nr:MAG: three-Cys-motif partner protein [Candidatus Kentron sp. UNK]
MIFSRLPRAEIILTFSTDAAINYISTLDDDPRWRKPFESLGLPKERIDKMQEEKQENKDWRQLIQFGLHQDICLQSGAKFYTPFFIASEKSNRSYWLVHLSNHEKARDVMTELHWGLKNYFSHYGGPGLWMFGYDPMKDTGITGQHELFGETEYSFDEAAKERTQHAIIEQLPKLIYEFPDGIRYLELYRRVANTTPATSEHIKEIAALLLEAKELEARGPNNEHRRSRIEKNDILRYPRQTTLFGNFGLSDIIRSRDGKKICRRNYSFLKR